MYVLYLSRTDKWINFQWELILFQRNRNNLLTKRGLLAVKTECVICDAVYSKEMVQFCFLRKPERLFYSEEYQNFLARRWTDDRAAYRSRLTNVRMNFFSKLFLILGRFFFFYEVRILKFFSGGYTGTRCWVLLIFKLLIIHIPDYFILSIVTI